MLFRLGAFKQKMSNVFRKIDEISEKLDYVTTAVFIMEENFENLDLIDFSLRDNLLCNKREIEYGACNVYV